MSTTEYESANMAVRFTSIDPRAIVARDAFVGSSCVIASGAVLCSGVTLESDVVVGPNAVFVEPGDAKDGRAAEVHRGVRIGANATIGPGIVLAVGSVVRPGAVVTRSVPPRAIVEGNPATIVGYVGTVPGNSTVPSFSGAGGKQVEATAVRGVTLHHFPVVPDLRGNLTVGEFVKEIPFVPMRFFMVFGVPSREIRGEHAHRQCHQFLICVRGSCAVVPDDGNGREEILLDAPNRGLYLPPMTWATQYKYSADALLLVFASHHYDASDYIRTYNEYTTLIGQA